MCSLIIPSLSCSRAVERTFILTSVSASPASVSFAALVTASSWLKPSWPASPRTSSGMSCFLFPARNPSFFATSYMLLSVPSSVVAFVPSPPPSFSSFLRCHDGQSTKVSGTGVQDPSRAFSLRPSVSTHPILDWVGSCSIRHGHSEIVVPDFGPGLSFADRPPLPHRLSSCHGLVFAGRSTSGSVLTHADFQLLCLRRGLSLLLLAPSRLRS